MMNIINTFLVNLGSYAGGVDPTSANRIYHGWNTPCNTSYDEYFQECTYPSLQYSMLIPLTK
jgi:hypothetical protein